METSSPVSYYFKYNDLSINSILNLKWALYGYFFYQSIIETLDNDDFVKTVSFNESLNLDFLKLKNLKKEFYVDNAIIDDDFFFKKEFETTYGHLIFTENSKIHFKLKLNVSEFIILQNALFPRLVFF